MVTKARVVAMADTEVIATCGECGLQLDEAPSLPVEERAPCPQCGGYARLFKAHLQAEVKLRSHLALSAKPARGGKPFLKGKFGLEFFRKTRAWHHVERTIDRRSNRYSERITDEAGNIVREVDEPLSDHRGRGSAKRAGSTD